MLGTGPPDAAGQHRAALDARLRRARRGGASTTCPAASRSSPASATTRSSSTSARSSTWPACGRSTPPPDPAAGRRRRRRRRAASTCTRSRSRSRSTQLVQAPRAPTIGVYASASRQKIRVLGDGRDERRRGAWVQVSRLGNPLDQRGRDPARAEGLLERVGARGRRAVRQDYTDPELPASITCSTRRLRRRRPTTGPRTTWSRSCSRACPGAELHRADAGRPAAAEHGASPPTAPSATGNRLGVLGGDLAGFPNGRRLEDDVTDIELRALACGYGAVLDGSASGSANRRRRTTCSATASTRTTCRSDARSRTWRRRTRATSHSAPRAA